MNCFSTYSR